MLAKLLHMADGQSASTRWAPGLPKLKCRARPHVADHGAV